MPLRQRIKNFLRRLIGRPPKSSTSSHAGTPINGTPPTSTESTQSKPPIVLSQPRYGRAVTSTSPSSSAPLVPPRKRSSLLKRSISAPKLATYADIAHSRGRTLTTRSLGEPVNDYLTHGVNSAGGGNSGYTPGSVPTATLINDVHGSWNPHTAGSVVYTHEGALAQKRKSRELERDRSPFAGPKRSMSMSVGRRKRSRVASVVEGRRRRSESLLGWLQSGENCDGDGGEFIAGMRGLEREVSADSEASSDYDRHSTTHSLNPAPVPQAGREVVEETPLTLPHDVGPHRTTQPEPPTTPSKLPVHGRYMTPENSPLQNTHTNPPQIDPNWRQSISSISRQQQEPITIESIRPITHEHAHETITQDIHHHHIQPIIQPLLDRTVLPPKHYLAETDGSVREISAQEAEKHQEIERKDVLVGGDRVDEGKGIKSSMLEIPKAGGHGPVVPHTPPATPPGKGVKKAGNSGTSPGSRIPVPVTNRASVEGFPISQTTGRRKTWAEAVKGTP